jgi:hypothetical protein
MSSTVNLKMHFFYFAIVSNSEIISRIRKRYFWHWTFFNGDATVEYTLTVFGFFCLDLFNPLSPFLPFPLLLFWDKVLLWDFNFFDCECWERKKSQMFEANNPQTKKHDSSQFKFFSSAENFSKINVNFSVI